MRGGRLLCRPPRWPFSDPRKPVLTPDRDPETRLLPPRSEAWEPGQDPPGALFRLL